MTVLSTDEFLQIYAAELAEQLQSMGVAHATILAATEAAAEAATKSVEAETTTEPQPPTEMGETDIKNGFATLTLSLVRLYEHTLDPHAARREAADFLLSLVSVLHETGAPT